MFIIFTSTKNYTYEPHSYTILGANKTGGNYAKGTLRVTKTTDEDGKVQYTFTDYVYDSLSRLTQQGENTSKAVSSSGIYLQNYYDNYASLRSAVSGNSNYPDDTSGNSRGFLIGIMTKVLGTDTKLYTAFYYDIEGRVTKKMQQNMLGGHDITTTTYSFSGKPLTVTHAHTASGKTARTEVYTYTYDEKDRVSTVKHKLGSAEVTLSSYTYDTFGRMANKQLHGSSTNQLTYSYNIQNWLTGISSAKFTQTLGYGSNYNGNISSMNWTANGESHSYTFTYDGVNRLLNSTHGTGAYTEKVTEYDKNGNIVRLQRYGTSLIDDLTYTYNGNQLTKMEDATGNAAGFSNGASAANEYIYDNNGNLTKDSNKGISNIAYNVLNLPSTVTFSDGSTITYSYAADGTKLRTVHTISGTTTTKDYCNNVVYENGVQKMLLTEEGYVDLSASTSTYYYYLKDHQGNNRVVINGSGTVVETNHYYPFGGVFASTGNVQPYKYNGKELDTKKGLNWYDYGARHYDATLGRWFAVDPLAEKYYATSVYGYCLNNPIKYIDIDGRKIVIGTPMQRLLGKLGLDSYVEKVSRQLEQNNMDSKRIQSVYNQLEASEHIYRILPLSESPYGEEHGNHVIPDSKTERGKQQGATMYYDPDLNQTHSGNERKARIALAHEMGHLEEYLKGNVIPTDKKKKDSGDKVELYKTELNESNSLSLENIIRKILDYGTRNWYYIEFKNE